MSKAKTALTHSVARKKKINAIEVIDENKQHLE